MTLFGVISALVLVLSALALALHFRVIRKRIAVDESAIEVDKLLRNHLDLLLDLSEFTAQYDEMYELWEKNLFSNTAKLVKTLPELERFLSLEDDEDKQDLESSNNEIELIIKTHNEKIQIYNEVITRFPWSIIAFATGLKVLRSL